MISSTPWALYPQGKSFQYPLIRATEVVWTLWKGEKSLAPATIRNLAVQPTAIRTLIKPVLCWKSDEVSEGWRAKRSEKPAWSRKEAKYRQQLASCWFIVTCSSKTSVAFQWTTYHYIPENGTLHNDCRENLTSNTSVGSVNLLPNLSFEI
jgi:hypothetical protein